MACWCVLFFSLNTSNLFIDMSFDSQKVRCERQRQLPTIIQGERPEIYFSLIVLEETNIRDILGSDFEPPE